MTEAKPLVDLKASEYPSGSRGYFVRFDWDHYPFDLVCRDPFVEDEQMVSQFTKKVFPGSPGYVLYKETPAALAKAKGILIDPITIKRRLLIRDVMDWKQWSEEERAVLVSKGSRKYTQVLMTCLVPSISDLLPTLVDMFEYSLSILQDIEWLCKKTSVLPQLDSKIIKLEDSDAPDKKALVLLESIDKGDRYAVITERRDRIKIFKGNLEELGLCPHWFKVYQLSAMAVTEIFPSKSECSCKGDTEEGEEDELELEEEEVEEKEAEDNETAMEIDLEPVEKTDVWKSIKSNVKRTREHLEEHWDTEINRNDQRIKELEAKLEELQKQLQRKKEKLDTELSQQSQLLQEYQQLEAKVLPIVESHTL